LDKIFINGGNRLNGRIRINGSKNASLPILVASLLTDERCIIENVPRLNDVDTILDVVKLLGKRVVFKGHRAQITKRKRLGIEAPYSLIKRMRASILVMGPILARMGRVRVSLPGGCAIGLRPIDIHLKGFRKMGAKTKISRGYIDVRCNRLKGVDVYLDYPSVGATENLMMAAVLAEGKTIIENAACEPEIVDLANFLKKMGGEIKGAGSSKIIIRGKGSLSGCRHRVIPDRIEAGTFMVACAICRGELKILGCIPQHMEALINKLREAGVKIKVEDSSLVVERRRKRPKPVDIETSPYPGFPTDMQAQWMVLMSIADGTSVITESVFEKRFLHIPELERLGCEIRVKGSSAIVVGRRELSGAPITATDLRASAALILAGLSAKGGTEVFGSNHLDRGYEAFESKLRRLGANIRRVRAR